MTVVFNSKAALVGGVMVGSFLLLHYLFDNVDVAILSAGISGLTVSLLLSFPYQGYFSLPHVLFIPTHVYCLLICYWGISFLLNPPPRYTAEELYYEEPKNIYMDSMEADLNKVIVGGHSKEIECTEEIENFLSRPEITTSALKHTSCFARLNKDSSNFLILVQFHGIAKLDKHKRQAWVNDFMEFLSNQKCTIDRNTFVGILNYDTLYTTSSPTGLHLSAHVSGMIELSEFYK